MTWIAVLAFTSAAELFQQGTVLFQNGHYKTAAERFAQAAEAAPKDARMWKALGVAYAAMSDYELADAPLERACKLDPSLDDACYYYGRNLYALNRFAPALSVLRKALRNDRAPWRVHLGVAQASEALGEAGEAETEFRTSVRLYEGLGAQDRGRPDFDPRLHYAVFLFRQGRLAEALPVAQTVVKQWPQFARGHFEVGRILHHQGELARAAEELERAVQGGFGAPAHLLLGRVYMRLGRTAEAEQQLKMAQP